MKKDFAGLNGFIWWIGVVEDRQDPLKLGRCRVRIAGWQTDDVVSLPTEKLPWAMPMNPLNMEIAHTPKEGDMVVGFFIDGENGQEPVMMGTLPGIPLDKAQIQKGFNDRRNEGQLSSSPVRPNEQPTNYPRVLDEPTTSRLARNETLDNSIVSMKKDKRLSIVEPEPYYNAKYPYNSVYESESGHALEFDDTKDSERVHIYHRAGSYIEWGPDGSRAERIQKDKFTVVVGDENVYIQGDVNIQVDGNYNLNVTGDIKINGKTINLNNGDMGAARIGDTADTGDDGTGSHYDVNSPGTNIIETGSETVFIGD